MNTRSSGLGSRSRSMVNLMETVTESSRNLMTNLGLTSGDSPRNMARMGRRNIPQMGRRSLRVMSSYNGPEQRARSSQGQHGAQVKTEVNREVIRKVNTEVNPAVDRAVTRGIKVNKEVNREVKREVNMDTSQTLNRKVNQEVSREVTQKVNQEVSREVSRKVNQEVSKEVTQKVNQEVTREMGGPRVTTLRMGIRIQAKVNKGGGRSCGSITVYKVNQVGFTGVSVGYS